jgi:hypothetical protein
VIVRVRIRVIVRVIVRVKVRVIVTVHIAVDDVEFARDGALDVITPSGAPARLADCWDCVVPQRVHRRGDSVRPRCVCGNVYRERWPEIDRSRVLAPGLVGRVKEGGGMGNGSAPLV